MVTTAQSSYPRNSANARPPGTFNLYLSGLSWPETAPTPRAANMAKAASMPTIVFLFIFFLLHFEGPRSARVPVRGKKRLQCREQLLRRLFGDPVTTFGDDGGLNVARN